MSSPSFSSLACFRTSWKLFIGKSFPKALKLAEEALLLAVQRFPMSNGRDRVADGPKRWGSCRAQTAVPGKERKEAAEGRAGELEGTCKSPASLRAVFSASDPRGEGLTPAPAQPL